MYLKKKGNTLILQDKELQFLYIVEIFSYIY